MHREFARLSKCSAAIPSRMQCENASDCGRGDGTAETLTRAFNGNMRSVNVTAPDGRKIAAEYGVLTSFGEKTAGATAVIEMAKASGLALMDENALDPLAATSRGTGELIASALNEGIRNILIGIGGSATNDGGMGAAAALGVKFLDADGNELSGCGRELALVRKIDLSGLRRDVFEAKITVMCDVDNPLTGKTVRRTPTDRKKARTPKH